MPVAQKKREKKRNKNEKKLHSATKLAFLLVFSICSDIS